MAKTTTLRCRRCSCIGGVTVFFLVSLTLALAPAEAFSVVGRPASTKIRNVVRPSVLISGGSIMRAKNGTPSPALSKTSGFAKRADENGDSKERDVPTKLPSLFDKAMTLIGSTTSLVVSGVFFIILALKRDSFMLSFFIGSIVNGILSKVLKKLLNQERPDNMQPQMFSTQPSDKGMPSSHAMSLGFIGVVTVLSCNNYMYVVLPTIVLYVLISLRYRISTNLHTWEQVLVGFVSGTLNGVMWKMYFEERVMEMIESSGMLLDNGTFPVAWLVIPACIGAIVVGSVERRIRKWMKILLEKNDKKEL